MARKIRRTKAKKEAPKNKLEKSLGRASVIGLCGGLLWSTTAMICHLLNFSSVGPELLFAPFPLGSWKKAIAGQFLAIAGLSLLSIPIALIFQFTLSKLKSVWVGIGYGLILWAVVFIVLRRWLPGLPAINRIGWNTLTTTACLFALYGLFIGYSIAFDIEEKPNSENYSKE
ncbi:YqhR family membrane protein [Sporolactobacillus pectinivorans]|uniref:YqhR family membrane protein n=1 Tax=Sporolactobacillus pectinivorans TaxID=1591408 RepID=UPI000C25882B|nr:YqhR family membrane protein [Sporolactobacillus pectinivorans]